MNNGLFDPAIVSFVFTPLVVTVAILCLRWWRQMHGFRAWRAGLDAPGFLLASAVRRMPAERGWIGARRCERNWRNCSNHWHAGGSRWGVRGSRCFRRANKGWR